MGNSGSACVLYSVNIHMWKWEKFIFFLGWFPDYFDLGYPLHILRLPKIQQWYTMYMYTVPYQDGND